MSLISLGRRCWLGVVLLQLGCASALLPDADEPLKTYLLNASLDPSASTQPSDLVLLISLPKAQPGFESRGIAYTRDPLALSYYTKSEWADTPAAMLASLVVNALESTGAFKAVIRAPAQAPAQLHLELDIITLQQEFFATPSQARVALRAKLFDARSRQVLATTLLETTEPAASEDAYGGVEAINKALRRLLAELAEFVLAQAARGFKS